MSTSASDVLTDFRIRFPEFVAVPDATINLYIADALEIFCLRTSCASYLAAHLYVLDQDSGAGGSGGSVDGGEGEVLSESAGGVSSSFKGQADNGNDSFYTVTPYGRKYLACRNSTPGYIFSVRSV
jgi:hypothetical protein